LGVVLEVSGLTFDKHFQNFFKLLTHFSPTLTFKMDKREREGLLKKHRSLQKKNPLSVGQGYKTFFVVSITLWLTKLDHSGRSVHCINKLVRFTMQTFFTRV
jgi:hypothetical protein